MRKRLEEQHWDVRGCGRYSSSCPEGRRSGVVCGCAGRMSRENGTVAVSEVFHRMLA